MSKPKPAPEFSLIFSTLSPPLTHQLDEQGFEFISQNAAEVAERAAANIRFLKIHRFLTEAEREKANRRLMKRITKSIQHKGAAIAKAEAANQ